VSPKVLVLLGLSTVCLFGQQAAPGAPRARPAGNQGNRMPAYDAASVDRGQGVFVANCGFCHGANAKGGEGGPDLIRSVVVLDDEGGKEIGEIMKAGRLDQGMPKFDLPAQSVVDIANFLHQRVTEAAYRETYQVQNILVGDAKAGEAFFNGAGGCKSCHSPAGDLRGVGSKYETEALQNRMVMPRQRRGGTPVTATITAAGKSFTGQLVRLTDFDVTIREASGAVRTFARVSEDNPKIEKKDPLQGHLDMLPKWKDSDMHNVTAYLVTLK
jgi:cytochrome c oxidase cbb3-type subunit III